MGVPRACASKWVNRYRRYAVHRHPRGATAHRGPPINDLVLRQTVFAPARSRTGEAGCGTFSVAKCCCELRR
ncbi:hypothetical protein CDO52_14655 [Nocardiopsis gilva YIM 90087]|uniref:DNA-binding domain-containing protein n=1 Tax=Nocardiopsis gilva YIM 90087 TaxID=1235441 RepID=A0A223S6W9_9ACTN|nr:hypothetical protein CDO52_14655 [Nocardiopsis gilva YIM 90087]